MQPRFLALAPFLLAAPAAAADDPDWSQAPRVEIALANFAFRPAAIHLDAGRPVVIQFRNVSRDTHAFSSRSLFKAAEIRASDRRTVTGGTIDLGGGEMREVGLIPKAGRYRVSCTQQYHATLGMTAEVVVD